MNREYQVLRTDYRDFWIAADAWTYLGNDGIILTAGHWAIAYFAYIDINIDNDGLPVSIRSTINNANGSTVIISRNYLMRLSFIDIVYTNGINNLKVQIYTPKTSTWRSIAVGIQAIKLRP